MVYSKWHETKARKTPGSGTWQTEDKLHSKLADIDIDTTEKTSLLGVVLDDNLKFDDDISSICRKVLWTIKDF